MVSFIATNTPRVRQRISRNSRGQSFVVLILLLTVFFIGPLSLLAFEIARFCLAQQQLKACVESAALAGAATIASSNTTDPTTTQNAAMATALNMFQQNSILGQSLASTTQSTTASLSPSANQAAVYFQFLDPVTRQAVSLGSTNGKILQVTGAFGVAPLFQQFIGLAPVYVATDVSNGGLPMLDLILCFDISASMDDFTPVSIIDRYNNGTTNGYSIIGQGPLYTAFGATSSTGTAVNATFPQGLDNSSGSDGVYTFNGSARGQNNNAIAPSSKSAKFTDLVVNIDGTNTFSTGMTVTYAGNSYNFPANNIGCLVEAARGNLESITVANAAGVPYISWNITPKSGYYQAYLQASLAQRHPIGDAILAAQNFFTIMNNDCDVHFGLVTFSSAPGTSSTSTVSPDDGSSIGNITDQSSTYVSNAYPSDPLSPKPPNPTINLIPTLGPTYSNFSTVNSSIQPVLAYGGTDIAGALKTAINQMKSTSSGGLGLTRSGSTKAIVLFTDGLPTVSSLGGNPLTDARTEASAAKALGIPIYCLGLCMVSSLQTSQTAILTDQNSNASTGGIAGISGNGAAYYQATQLSELNLIFENTARALVQLVH